MVKKKIFIAWKKTNSGENVKEINYRFHTLITKNNKGDRWWKAYKGDAFYFYSCLTWFSYQ